MSSGRRLLVLLAVCAVVALPAGLLRATCAGSTCDQGNTAVQARVPFCPLPAGLKTLIASGFRAGRSPDVVGVAATSVTGGAGEASTPWPGTDPEPDTRVPLAFLGTGVDPSVELPEQLTLDRVAPTLAEILGFRRSHPEVRAGLSITGLAAGDRPRLVLELVWTGGGARSLQADPGASRAWRRLTSTEAVASMQATTGSVPLDPVAVLTTIGTGGPPSQHGITGALIRNDEGHVVVPWSAGAPPSVLATLPDDLMNADAATKVGAVLPDRTDLGIVGGTWYGTGFGVDVRLERRHPDRAVSAMLANGYGTDETPDVLAVVVEGPAASFARALSTIVPAVRAAVPATTVVVTATGERSAAGSVRAADVADHVDANVGSSASVVAAAVPGGLFLDQDVLAGEGLSSGDAVQPMLGMRDPAGRKVFVDAFPGFAVSFARYC